jgi:hypothetical protein
MIKPSDLNPTQRKSYDLWRDLGLTESAAMNALVEDGVIRLSEEEKLARSFRDTWGLSEAQAEIAARGRDSGPSSRPVSESLAGLRPDPANIPLVVAKVEELATEQRSRGASVERALYEAAFAVMHAQLDERTADWVVKVVEKRWPGVWARMGRSSGTVQG